MKLTRDEGTLKTLHHLLTREVSHTQMFLKALDNLCKPTEPLFGNVAPDDTADVYFNLSHGEDERGPWNSEPDFRYERNPAPRAVSARRLRSASRATFG